MHCGMLFIPCAAKLERIETLGTQVVFVIQSLIS